MTRKHFIAIAAAIRTSITSRTERVAIARALVPALGTSNERFNAQKFLEAAIGR